MSLNEDARLLYTPTLDDLRFKIAQMQRTIDAQSEALERLQGLVSEGRPTLQEIMEVVCEFYAVTPHEVKSARRLHDYVHPRLVIYYLARKLTRMSMQNIGSRIGGRDHTTIISGFLRISKIIRKNEVVRDDVDELRVRIAEKVLRRELATPKERLLQLVVRHDHSVGRVA